jgi:hypothetical protein
MMRPQTVLTTIYAVIFLTIPAFAASLTVAAKDSAKSAIEAADFRADGTGDQDEINAAVRALPPVGGTVFLLAGTYDIRRVPEKLGGVLIERSNVVLAGEGPATKLIQAPKQDTNVIRIIGSGVGYVTIRDLYVDANRDQNSEGAGDPNISHGRFEFSGIKAFCEIPGKTADPCHHITVQNCIVRDAHRLGIMIEGRHINVINNFLGNAGSDSVEILTGPGQIRGNTFEITGRTHVAAGSDRGDDIIMADNIVHVKDGGDLDVGFRSWADSNRHVIANNVLLVDPGGRCTYAMDVRGFHTTITGNNIYTFDKENPTRLRITGSNAVITGNAFENVIIEVNDQTDRNLPIILKNNLMTNAAIDHKKGNLVTQDPRK